MTTPEETKEIAKLIAGRFIERRDVKAIQTRAGAYMPHRVGPQKDYNERPLVPVTLDALVEHVEGRQSYGHYLVAPTNTCRMFAFDIDLNKSAVWHPNGPDELGIVINPREVWSGPTTPAKRDLALALRYMAQGLAIRTKKIVGCQVIVTYSGNKGMHVIGCLDPGTPAIEARDMAVLVLDSFQGSFEPFKGKNFWHHAVGYKMLDIEVFPKQEEISADGFGNLMRLPLGVNFKSGRPAAFLRLDVPEDKFAFDDPLTVLREGSLRGA